MRSINVIAAGLLVLAACGSDAGTSSPTTATPTTATPTTVAPTTTAAPPTTIAPVTTTVPATTTAPTTAATTVPTTLAPTTSACAGFGSTDEVKVDFPGLLSSLVGEDIRTGAHPCFERVVIDFEGSGTLPGYWVRYEDPVVDSPRGEVVDVEGDAALVVSAGAWMGTMDGEGYSGPRVIEPTNVTHILQLQLIENFEGMFSWAIGLDQQRPFRVDTLGGPDRLVIDVYTR